MTTPYAHHIFANNIHLVLVVVSIAAAIGQCDGKLFRIMTRKTRRELEFICVFGLLGIYLYAITFVSIRHEKKNKKKEKITKPDELRTSGTDCVCLHAYMLYPL